MKPSRQKCLIELITNGEINTQDELLEKLRMKGYDVTQATVSRDIKELKIIKIAGDNGMYKYAVTMQDDVKAEVRYKGIIYESVVDIKTAGNIAVIKTYPGMANAAAAAIDNMKFDEVVGTLAGDDTIFIAAETSADADSFAVKFRELFD
jgi:transcriptional regulator of arginine metabolism